MIAGDDGNDIDPLELRVTGDHLAMMHFSCSLDGANNNNIRCRTVVASSNGAGTEKLFDLCRAGLMSYRDKGLGRLQFHISHDGMALLGYNGAGQPN